MEENIYLNSYKKLYEIASVFKKQNQEFNRYLPKGILIHGPIGMGKSFLAKNFINHSSVDTLYLKDFTSLEELVQKIEKNSSCIIYIEDIDKYINQQPSFLTSMIKIMENTKENKTVMFLLTCKDKTKLPVELLSSGYVDLHIPLYSLSKEIRREFLNELKSDNYFDPKIDIEKILSYTSSMTWDDLKRLKKESILYTLRKGIPFVSEQLLIEQASIIQYGYRTALSLQSSEIKESAYHEAAHAVISKILFPEVKIEYISVTSREKHLGLVQYNNTNYIDIHVNTVKNKIIVALAGRIAQVKAFGVKGIDTSAQDDLKKATHYAYKAIAHWGMDEEMGYITLSDKLPSDFCKEKIEQRVSIWMKEAKNECELLVKENWNSIEQVAELLLEKEMINEKEFLECMSKD